MIARHFPNSDDLDDMPMLKLLKLAKDMGVESNDLIEATERDETERSRYSMRYPGFRGELEFDMTIAALGQSITRKAKVVYDTRPNGSISTFASKSVQRERRHDVPLGDLGRSGRIR